MNIEFRNKVFCFTGSLAQLKRTQAEREVRSRLGLTQKNINNNLDYLVVGSIPNPAWKHGDYGNKIESARQFIREGANLILVPEYIFMDALAAHPIHSDGDIDYKYIVVRYKSFVNIGDYDHETLGDIIDELKRLGWIVNASMESPEIYQDLYSLHTTTRNTENLFIFQARLVNELAMEVNCQDLVDTIAKLFESVRGLDGEISYIEKKQGTASYISLIKSLPQVMNIYTLE